MENVDRLYIYIYIFIYVLYIYILNLIAKKSIPRQQKPKMHTGRSLGQADPIEQHFNSKQLTRWKFWTTNQEKIHV